jgi:hypothetical protein
MFARSISPMAVSIGQTDCLTSTNLRALQIHQENNRTAVATQSISSTILPVTKLERLINPDFLTPHSRERIKIFPQLELLKLAIPEKYLASSLSVVNFLLKRTGPIG